MIYLDHAATSPLRPAAQAAMADALAVYGNPSSVHQVGQKARFMLDEARRSITEVLGVRPEALVFTASGTEANNLALQGVMAAHPGKRLLVSSIEHACVTNAAQALAAQGVPVAWIPVDAQGVVNMDWLAQELAKGDVALVSVMHANNEIGTLQPIAEIAKLCRQYGAYCHTDAVQTVGHIPVNTPALGSHLLSFSAHKFGGPLGVGGLVVGADVTMNALVHGGAQERNRRAGTENMPAIVGAAAALQEAVAQTTQETELYNHFAAQLTALIPTLTGVQMVANTADKLAHICQLLTPGIMGEDLVMALDIAGIAVSQGAACSSGKVTPSHVLGALGYNEHEAQCGIRVSAGWCTTRADIQTFIQTLNDVMQRHQRAA